MDRNEFCDTEFTHLLLCYRIVLFWPELTFVKKKMIFFKPNRININIIESRDTELTFCNRLEFCHTKLVLVTQN